MITFLPPPDGVPIEPIKHPYAIENKIVAAKPFICDRFEDVKRIKDIPIGNIIAATVCSPINEDNILLKKALIDLDKELIKSLSLDNNFTFNEIAKIYFYNLDINNFEFSESNRDNLNNFFIKAVDRLSNEKN